MRNENEYQVFDELWRRYNDGHIDAAGEIILRMEPMIKERCNYYFEIENEELMRDARVRCFELIKRYNPEFIGTGFPRYMNQMLANFFFYFKKRTLNSRNNKALSTYVDAASH